jgi:membrane protease YdiL (CAAX protease family)
MRNGYFGIPRSIAIVIGITIGFQVIGGVFLVLFNGIDIKSGSPSVIITVNSLAQLLMMLGLPILISRSMNHDFFETFRLEGMSESRLALHLIGIPIIAVGQILGGALASLWIMALSQFPDLYSSLDSFQRQLNEMMQGLTTAHSPAELAILLLGGAIVPAFAEESFFRGFIQTHIERSGKNKSRPFIAIIITSILFAAVHLSPLEFPGLLTLGVLLGWLAYRTCDLRVSALAHAFNNGIIFVIAYLSRNDVETVQTLTGSPALTLEQSLIAIVTSVPILFILLYIFQKMTAPIQARENADVVIAEYKMLHAQSQMDS